MLFKTRIYSYIHNLTLCYVTSGSKVCKYLRIFLKILSQNPVPFELYFSSCYTNYCGNETKLLFSEQLNTALHLREKIWL